MTATSQQAHTHCKRLWLPVLAGLLSLGLLAGCGFELIKPLKMPEPLRHLRVTASDRYTDFHQELMQGLEQAGVSLNEVQVYGNLAVKSIKPGEPSSEQPITVDIIKDVSGQNVLSVSANNTPTEFEVFYTVQFKVSKGTQELLPPTELTLRHEYSYAVTAELAKQHERDTVRQALAHEISILVIRRISALTNP